MMNKVSKVLIACSGGPDSMALLDILRRECEVICAHVNYHKRETALRDEQIVYDYCLKYKIPFFKKDVYFKDEGNFQNWAREKRYQFFKEIYEENNCEALCIGQHLDDYLETYLLQKKRGSIPQYWGIQALTSFMGMKIIRPLLNYQKKDLEAYCLKEKVPYGIDESNFKNDYRRNRIRHQIVEHLSLLEKKKLYQLIELENKNRKKKELDLQKLIGQAKELDYRSFIQEEKALEILRYWLYPDLSHTYLKEILRQLQESEQFEIEVRDKTLYKEYGKVGVYNTPLAYEYVLSEIKEGNYGYFKIVRDADSFHSATVDLNDFPLTIRSFRKGDQIAMRYGHKKIARFFIDHKIPSRFRKIWPIVLNAKGEIVLVPQIGCNKSHYSIKPNLFVIEYLVL